MMFYVPVGHKQRAASLWRGYFVCGTVHPRERVGGAFDVRHRTMKRGGAFLKHGVFVWHKYIADSRRAPSRVAVHGLPHAGKETGSSLIDVVSLAAGPRFLPDNPPPLGVLTKTFDFPSWMADKRFH